MTSKKALLTVSLASTAWSFLLTGLDPAYAQEAVYVQVITLFGHFNEKNLE